MIQKLKNTLLTLMGTAVLLAPVAAISPVFADGTANTTNKFCAGIKATGDTPQVATPGTNNCETANADDSAIVNLLRAIVNILSVVVGIVAVIMIIIAGFRYITSGGESSKVSGAKNAIIYAIVGLLIVALAQIIVRFVITRAFGGVSSQTQTGI